MTEPAIRAARGLPACFNRYQPVIASALKAALAGRELPLYDTLRYYMGWADTDGNPVASMEGKRLRPTLCLLACEAVGGDVTRALPAAVSLEFVHNFSLIHDDIEDGDRTRHHRPTLWAVWGEPIAIVAGSALLTLAGLEARRLGQATSRESVSIAASEALTNYYLRMMEGQYLDIGFEGRLDVTVEEYLDMIERKTGALIECSIYLGALAGSDDVEPDEAKLSGLRQVGHEIGRVFQIRDDILGIWGGPETGKPVGADIRRKKKSLPMVHALTRASRPLRDQMATILSRDLLSSEDVEQVLKIMGGLGTREWCEEAALLHWRQGQAALASLSISDDARADFLELGEFLLVRES